MTALKPQRLDSRDAAFTLQLDALLDRAPEISADITQVVDDLIAQVRADGDAAVVALTNRFDRRSVQQASELVLEAAALETAWKGLPADLRDALSAAAARITAYAEHQKIAAFEFTDAHGNRLGQRVTPMDRVGLYVPGGKAAYPSSVLMNALPAKVAGAGEVVMVVPAWG